MSSSMAPLPGYHSLGDLRSNNVYWNLRDKLDEKESMMRSLAGAFVLLLVLFPGVFLGQQPLEVQGPIPPTGSISATQFLPEDYVTDGSISYQPQLQKAIDTAAQLGTVLVFPPMIYLLEDEAGLTVHSGTTLFLYGAVFRFDHESKEDGQVFLGRDVTDVQFLGGEIAGQRTAWAQSVNIAGIRITGNSARIRVQDMFIHDLSSNGIGVFGPSDEPPIKDVFVTNTIVRNCCNVYVDYLQPGAGPARGSQREDQGGIAFYHVESFVIRGCSFEDSTSDGTHFFRCRHGQFTDNQVTGSQMGGYFLEGCQGVLASGNLIQGNGSRGVTIERDSRDCTLIHNLVEQSGREGLWAPDVSGCLVANNVFRENGRKDHEELDSEIKIEETDKYETVTEDFRVTGNTFYTTASQDRAIWITSGACGIVVENNSMRGPARTIRADAWLSGSGQAIVRNNDGWKTENVGVARLDGDGKRTGFRIPHGLDFPEPDDPRMLQHVKIVPLVTGGSGDAAGPLFVSADTQAITVEFLAAPPSGKGNVTLNWSVRVANP